MNLQKKLVSDFLSEIGMNYSDIDVEKNCREFVKEMETGLTAEGSSLRMIPTYIQVGKRLTADKKIIVADIGGTNFRRAVIKIGDEGTTKIENYSCTVTPGTESEVEAEIFFKEIALFLRPVIEESDTICICFSYAAQPQPSGDAKVLALSKQLYVKDLIGKMLGESLINAMRTLGMPTDKKIVVLNDSVASLLYGIQYAKVKNYDSYIGLILGTGMNSCYVEKNECITKISDADKAGQMVINAETGDYAKFPLGEIDKEFDRTLPDHGNFLFEKMVAGKSQGSIFLMTIKRAAVKGLFSDAFKEKIAAVDELPSYLIDRFLEYPDKESILSDCCAKGSSDSELLYYLMDMLLMRSALLLTINLAAIMRKRQIGQNPCKPVCICVDGSTFQKSKTIQAHLAYFVRKYINEEFGLYCDIISVENATLVGTAIAGLV